MTFFLILASGAGCFLAGMFVTKNPERVKGWWDALKAKLGR